MITYKAPRLAIGHEVVPPLEGALVDRSDQSSAGLQEEVLFVVLDERRNESLLIKLTVTEDDGATGSRSQNVTVSGGITLSLVGYRVRGLHKADLSWDGATSTNVDIYRNAAKITTTANDASTPTTSIVADEGLTPTSSARRERRSAPKR